MLWYKYWRESWIRFSVSAALVAGLCLYYVLMGPRLYAAVAKAHPHRILSNAEFVYLRVFGGPVRGTLQLICLLLGMGGLQRDRKSGSLGFTLGLPVGRLQLVAVRAGVGLCEIAALSLMVPVLVWAVMPVVGLRMPLEYGLAFVPLWIVGGWVTFAMAFLCSVVIPSEYGALAVACVLLIFYMLWSRVQKVVSYDLHLGDLMMGRGHLDYQTMLWTSRYSMGPVVGFFLAGLVMVVLGMMFTEWRELN